MAVDTKIESIVKVCVILSTLNNRRRR